MVRLIQNEFIKVFSKVGTWVLLALGILLILVYQFILRQDNQDMYASGSIYQSQYMEGEIRYVTESKPEGWELTVEFYTFLIDHELFFIEGGWKEEAANSAFYMYREEPEFEELTGYLIADDWRGYYQYRLRLLAADENLSEEELRIHTEYYEYLLDQNVEPYRGDWREPALQNYRDNRLIVWNGDQPGSMMEQESYETAKATAAAELWRLSHNQQDVISELVDYQAYGGIPDSFWNSFDSSSLLIQAFSVFMIIVAAGCMAGEFSGGTIKFLLINPVSRRKIFFSKYSMLILLGMIGMIGVFCLQAIFGLLVHGGDLTIPWLGSHGGELRVGSAVGYMAKQYLFHSVEILTSTTMAFMISSLLRSSAIAIGVSLAALLAGNTIVMFLSMLGQDWGRYLIFANTNLTGDGFFFPGQTVGFAGIVAAVYMAVYVITAYDGFTRREV